MKIKLRNDIAEFEDGLTAKEVALRISEGLGRVAIAAKINGKAADLTTV
ncbi:MAG: TGS domain-containing protein, partial [Christensenellaceae bacterium]|nr:TGS domain-containing protein [Christensenellaceae bacterium]